MPTLGDPIPIPQDIDNPATYYDIQLRELFLASHNLSFTERDGAIQHNDKAGNFDAIYVVFTSNGVANTEDAVTHGLNRTPRGYIPVRQDKSAVLYETATAHTSTTLYWKSTAATTAWTVLVF